MDLSRKINRRRTETYFQRVSEDKVRAPQMRIPRPGKLRIALTPFGLIPAWTPSLIWNLTSRAAFRISLAGDLKTPRSESVRAYTPKTCPPGGMIVATPVSGSEILIQGA